MFSSTYLHFDNFALIFIIKCCDVVYIADTFVNEYLSISYSLNVSLILITSVVILYIYSTFGKTFQF